ncbi:reverse transcriptase domain-containing protein [Tanacetum coccineum]
MTLELADRSISRAIGIAKDVNVKVGVFQFPADFMVVDFEPDPRVPLILGRCFLKTSRALIDVYKGELTLRVDNEAITYNLDQTSRYSVNYNDMTANRIDVVELACEEYSQEVLGFSDMIASGNPTPDYDPIVSNSSPTLTPFGDSNFLLLEEADAFLAIADDQLSPKLIVSYYDPEGDLIWCEAKTAKSSIDEPPEVKLKDLPPHLEYAFLEDNNKLPVIIAKDLSVDEKLNEATRKDHFPLPFMDQMLERTAEMNTYCFRDVSGSTFILPIDRQDQEKTTFTLPIRIICFPPHAFGYAMTRQVPKGFLRRSSRLFNISRTHDHLLGEKTLPFFFSRGMIQDFQTLKRKLTEAPILIAPDWDQPFELMCDASDYAIGAVLGQRIEKHFRPIHYASKTMTEAESNYTTTEKEMLAVVYAFEKFRSYLIMNKSIVYTDHSALKYLFAKKDAKARLLRWVLLLQEFDFNVIDTKD